MTYMQKFITFSDGSLLDLEQVEYVGPSYGLDKLRYTIRLRSGLEVTISEKQLVNERSFPKECSLPRETFLKLLKAQNDNPSA